MQLTFNQSIQKTLEHEMTECKKIILLGLGITDPKRFFGTTTDLLEKFGADRVLECPTSENAYLGHALGLSLGGLIPVVHFQRMDFMLYAFDQLVNNIAKWKEMFHDDMNLPIVIRSLVGMGWGQGAQHSQNLAPLLAQIPGLKVVTPSSPESASVLLRQSLRGKDPVLFCEHRWLQYLKQDVSELDQDWQIGKAKIHRKGNQATVVCWSYSVVEVLRFLSFFPELDWDVIDLVSLSPLDTETVFDSFAKTKKLIVWEPGWSFAGIGAEIISKTQEKGMPGEVLRIGFTHSYPSASPRFLHEHYPSIEKIVESLNAKFLFNLKVTAELSKRWPVDQDQSSWSPWL